MKAISAFGKKMKELRLQKDMSINAVSKKSGVSQSYLSQIENGARDTPQPDTIKKIASGLDVDYFVLMKAAGFMATSNEIIKNDDEDLLDLYFKKNRKEKEIYYTKEEIIHNFFDLNHLVSQSDYPLLYKGRVITDKEIEKVRTMLKLLLED